MKKIKFFLPLILILLYSCSDNLQLNKLASTTQTSSTTRSKVRGDNLYDLLGFGCDITGPYLDQMKSAYQVIDINALKAANPDLINSDYPSHTDVIIHGGSNAKTLTTKLDIKLSVTASIPLTDKLIFTGGLNSQFIDSNTISDKYSYAYADVNCYRSHHAIKKFTDISILQNYLSAVFKNDLLTKTCDQIVALYGTHVYTDIYTGGQLKCIYKSRISNSSDEQTVSYGANAGIKDLCGLTSSVNYTKSSTAQFSEESLSCVTVGGSTITPLTWQPGQNITFNFNEWSTTVPTSLQLIDIGDSSLVAIYEFVADPVKKAALKIAVDNYIIGKKLNIIPTTPLYRLWNGLTSPDHHLYTTDYNEVMSAMSSGWRLEGIEGYVIPSTFSTPNAVPLYRYFNKKTGDRLITTNYAELGAGNSSWNYEGIKCNVYNIQMPQSVPLYRYNNGHDHFFTTSYSIYSGFSLEGTACYVL